MVTDYEPFAKSDNSVLGARLSELLQCVVNVPCSVITSHSVNQDSVVCY